MRLLQRVIYGSAAAHLLGGIALFVLPGTVMEALGQPLPDLAWVRLIGVQAVMTGLMQVIVGHRVETMWWFSWTFVFGSLASALVFGSHALVGVPEGTAIWPWWFLTAFGALGVVTLLFGLAKAGLEKPAE